jgi:hypothetical protein
MRWKISPFPDGKKAIHFKDWDKKYQQIFIDRGLY